VLPVVQQPLVTTAVQRLPVPPTQQMLVSPRMPTAPRLPTVQVLPKLPAAPVPPRLPTVCVLPSCRLPALQQYRQHPTTSQ